MSLIKLTTQFAARQLTPRCFGEVQQNLFLSCLTIGQAYLPPGCNPAERRQSG